MRKLLRALLLLTTLTPGACGAPSAGPTAAPAGPPTDNPVATYYSGPEGYPAWTDRIFWDRVVDMEVLGRGRSAFEAFEEARDALAARGGGVLYYPPGVYDFSDMPADGPRGRGLLLPSGVVLRGATPVTSPDATDGFLPLQTTFVFGMRPKRERARLTLEGGMRWQRVGSTASGDVTLAFRLEGGTPNVEVVAHDPALTKRHYVVPAETSAEDGTWRIRTTVALAPPPRENRWEDASVVYDVRVRRDGDELAGTYTATFAGERFPEAPVTGEVRGTMLEPGAIPRDWNLVGLKRPASMGGLADVHDVGLCWVRLVGAVVYFGPELAWTETWADAARFMPPEKRFMPLELLIRAKAKEAWKSRVPDGTHPLDALSGARWGLKSYRGAGSGRLVFGCVLEDAAVSTDTHDMGAGPDSFHTHKYGARIGITGSRVFVANNLAPKSDRSFIYSQDTQETSRRDWGKIYPDTPVLFDYGKQIGIDVNKDGLRQTKDDPMGRASDGYYLPGVVVRDNRVYNHGHKSFSVSGTWVTLEGNMGEREYLRSGDEVYGPRGTWVLTMDGYLQSRGGGTRFGGECSDNLSRGFDLAGQNVWVHDNAFGPLGSDPGNDGEAILCQLWGGTPWQSWTATYNRHEDAAEGEPGYIGPWAAPMYGALIAWNRLPGAIGALASRGTPVIDAAFVPTGASKVHGIEDEKTGGRRPTDAILGGPAEGLTPPADVTAEAYDGDAVRITWTDASQEEIGFRVDRQIDGGPWRTIAYRPRHSQGHPKNPQAWIDFTAPTGRQCRYRVVAIDSHDDGRGASSPVGPVVLESPRKGP